MTLPPIDHLVYTVPELAAAIDAIEALLGVRPAPGGRHPDFGTHNALLSLGDATYLEVIAPDPTNPDPPRGIVFGMAGNSAARLATWMLRAEAIEETAAAATAAGLDVGAIERGRRRTADGGELTWAVSDPHAMLLGGAFPCLIAWGDTPHPAAHAPRAGTLAAFRIDHPDPERLAATLDAIGGAVEVRAAPAVRLVATIETAGGAVELS